MYKTNELLDMAKAKLEVSSDYALAKKLGITRGAVSNYRQGLNFLSNEVAYNIAKLLWLHPLTVVASVEYERAVKLGDKNMQKLWFDAAQENR